MENETKIVHNYRSYGCVGAIIAVILSWIANHSVFYTSFVAGFMLCIGRFVRLLFIRGWYLFVIISNFGLNKE